MFDKVDNNKYIFLRKAFFIRLGKLGRCFFKNGPTPASLIIYFQSFQTNTITIFTTNICEKCPSSIWCQDSNPQPLEHESPPITTRPGLPPSTWKMFEEELDTKNNLRAGKQFLGTIFTSPCKYTSLGRYLHGRFKVKKKLIVVLEQKLNPNYGMVNNK